VAGVAGGDVRVQERLEAARAPGLLGERQQAAVHLAGAVLAGRHQGVVEIWSNAVGG
jgi:hypothetical protein